MEFCVRKVKEAILNEEIRTVENLIKPKATLINTAIDSDGTRFIHLAANTSSEMIQLLINNGAHINTQTNNDLYTPLHVAAMNGCTEVVKALLSYNWIDTSLMDADLLTARDCAEEEDHWDIVSLIDNFNTAKEEERRREEGDNDDISICEAFVNMTVAEHHDSTIDYEDETLPYNTSTADTTLELPYNGTTLSYNGDSTEEGKQDSIIEHNHVDNSKSTSNSSNVADDLSTLTNSQLRDKLESLGERPGPINHLTRKVYIVYLQKILGGAQPSATNQGYKGFKYELALCLNGTSKIPNLLKDEKAAFAEFRVAGQSKSFFNYLLLDPLVLDKANSVGSSASRDDVIMFKDFVESVFYVGKGKNARSHQHLKDSKHTMESMSTKVQRINSIWKEGQGVISLHVFNNISAGEAYCREAAMIDAIGRDNLTNAVRGHYHGLMSHWSSSQQRMFGVYLLHKAFLSFQIDTPQPIFPQDI